MTLPLAPAPIPAPPAPAAPPDRHELLVRLRRLAARQRDLERQLAEAEVAALAAGASYGDVGLALGLSRQAVRQRHARRVGEA